MYSARVKPHQITRALDEAIHRHVGLIQVLQVGPPGTHQEVDVVPGRGGKTKTVHSYQCQLWGLARKLAKKKVCGDVPFTEVVDDTPVRFRHSKPLAVPRTNVDVDGTEIVVLLVTCNRKRT